MNSKQKIKLCICRAYQVHTLEFVNSTNATTPSTWAWLCYAISIILDVSRMKINTLILNFTLIKNKKIFFDTWYNIEIYIFGWLSLSCDTLWNIILFRRHWRLMERHQEKKRPVNRYERVITAKFQMCENSSTDSQTHQRIYPECFFFFSWIEVNDEKPRALDRQ